MVKVKVALAITRMKVISLDIVQHLHPLINLEIEILDSQALVLIVHRSIISFIMQGIIMF